jgi:hypothetical protein
MLMIPRLKFLSSAEPDKLNTHTDAVSLFSNCERVSDGIDEICFELNDIILSHVRYVQNVVEN